MLKQIRTYVFLIFMLFTIGACSHGIDAHDSYGHPIRLADFRGKWIFINYWALWCKPCLNEIPALQKLYQQNKDKVVVLGVSYDALSNRAIREIAKKLGATFPMLSSFPMEKLGTNNISVLPMTFIINPQGQLYKILKGPQSKQNLLKAIGLKSRVAR